MKKTNWLMLLLLLMTTVICKAQVGSVLWQEDFNTLNTSIWNVITGDGTGTPAGAGWGNMELQYYNTPNVYISDVPGESGNKALVLEAKAEAMGSRAFTSGKVTSSDKLSIKYGLVEMRLRVPNLQTGLWPAAWLLGTSTANWPAKGEIDMMEMGHNIAERTRQGFPNAALNNYVGSNLIFYSADAVSTGNPSGAASTAWDVTYDSPYVSATPLSDRFVLYRMYWSSTAIRFTVVDGGVETDLYTSPFTLSAVSDEFNNPFYLLFNLAVGGTFTDASSNGQITAPLPGKMYVDYVKVSKWNNEGEVTIGGPAPKTGTFGIFTDNTATTDKLAIGTSADIWAWNNCVTGTTAAYEGSNVLAWATTDATQWFGGGIQARQITDMSNFATSGNLKFRIKIPANVNFKVGMTDNYTNEKFISFPANTNQYGLTRDGNWGQVTIPISSFGGTLAFQSMNYLFAIVSDGALPSSTIQFAVDDIYWEGGGGVVNVPVTGVTLTSTASVAVGATNPLTATIAPTNASNKNVTWSSSNTAIATVSTSGVVTGVAAGNATITVTTTNGAKTATCAVTVTSVASNLALNKPITVSSTEVATTPGSYAVDGNATTRWSSVFADPQWIYVDLGATYNVNRVKITWEAACGSNYLVQSSTDASTWTTMKTVTGNSTLVNDHTGLTGSGRYIRIYGTTRATAYGYSIFELEVYGTSSTTVSVTGVSLSPTSATITAGGTQQLTATVAPSNATNKTVSYTSSNTAVATVNASGLISSVAAGSATITVTTQDGSKTATCAVMVNAATIAVTGVTMSPTTASIAIGATQQLTATVAPTNATTKTVTYASSNTAVATVNASGLVTAIAAGNATVTVTTTSGAKTATCAVTVTGSTPCSVTASTGDFKVNVSSASSNPTLTFVPVLSGAGSGICILYYSTSLTATFPGYIVTPNTPYQITAPAGATVYFYYTYSTPSNGEKSTVNSKNSFTVGSCSTLKAAAIESEVSDTKECSFEVYPVPMKDKLTLKFAGNIYQYAVVYDMNGKELLIENISSTDNELVLNVSSLPKGVYYVSLQGNDIRLNKKVIK